MPLAASMVIIMMASLVVGAGSIAYFSDIESSNNN
ncbi:hypothetical protein J7K52_03900, partial [Candidatus Bathyarchaeota archaeon]|nr:hypothetical protein [Candidatus Bathyarchaeota archaeon]